MAPYSSTLAWKIPSSQLRLECTGRVEVEGEGGTPGEAVGCHTGWSSVSGVGKSS